MKSILVFGGNGFVGRKICEVGIRLGWSVTSVSRSGNPPKPVVHSDHQWISKVQWTKADLLNPESYKSQLKEKTAVVHSVGLLFENLDYKNIANSNFNFLNDLLKLGSFLKGSNPMEKNHNNTYEAIQRDLAVLLADAYLQEVPQNPAFVYISAAMKPPIVPDGYLTTKREAEFELLCKKGLRTIIMRPGIMYDEKEPGSNNRTIFAKLLNVGYGLKTGIIGDSIAPLNDLVKPAISTERVALSVYGKLGEPGFSGIVTLEEMAGP